MEEQQTNKKLDTIQKKQSKLEWLIMAVGVAFVGFTMYGILSGNTWGSRSSLGSGQQCDFSFSDQPTPDEPVQPAVKH